MKQMNRGTVARWSVLAIVATILVFPQTGLWAAESDAPKVALQADSGKWAARCRNCQNSVDGRFPDTVMVHVDDINPPPAYAQFEVVNVDGGKIALKADTGKFAARCRNCIVNAAYPDCLTVHVDEQSAPYAQFTPVMIGDSGKYALRADNDKYIARCRNCSPGAGYPDSVFIHATKPAAEPWAQWRIVPLTFPTGMKIAMQSADSGKWAARCRNCQNSVDGRFPDTVMVHVDDINPPPAYAQFEVVNVGGGKIALKADTGKFAARCRNCIVDAAYPDFLTVHVDNQSAPYAQFTPVFLDNGNYALRADTGNYVARCRNCSPDAAYPDSVTIHVEGDNPNRLPGYAQWNIIYLP